MLLQDYDNLGTTMEEYVRFETKKALRNSKVYNWETAKYGMVNWRLDEVDIGILRFFEPKFPSIIYNDALELEPSMPHEPTFDHDIYLNVETPLPKSDCKVHNSKAEKRTLKKQISKKGKFNILNIDEDLFFYNIPRAEDLKLDKSNDYDR
ncbi:hypothetical protein Tco_0750463 [Tanacetum coccineum]|uniref:Uncharacterized protein n=1 Tax=Tanacetum coccineum TaxID=301880 RepID=A0ABQ4Z4G1_9ASTR